MKLSLLADMFTQKSKRADPKSERKRQMRQKGFIDKKIIIAAFCAAVVLLAGISAATVFSEKQDTADTAAQITESKTAVQSKAAVAAAEQQETLNGNILLAFTKDGTSGLHMLSVLNIDSENGRVRISFIPPETTQQVNRLSGSMSNHIENGGIKELLWAVGEYADISIERYICLDEENFVDIMKIIGNFEIEIQESVNDDYNGINFIIEEGVHEFTADAMLKYVVYLCRTLYSDPEKLADVIAGLAGRLIADGNGNKISAESYEKAINSVDTDISALDIAQHTQALANLFDSGSLWKIEIVESPSLFGVQNS